VGFDVFAEYLFLRGISFLISSLDFIMLFQAKEEL